MRHPLEEHWPEILIGVACVVFIGLLIVLFVRDARAKAKCEHDGGHVTEYNCRTYMNCSTISHGNGNSSTTCYPTTSCDWRCDGLRAERP